MNRPLLALLRAIKARFCLPAPFTLRSRGFRIQKLTAQLKSCLGIRKKKAAYLSPVDASSRYLAHLASEWQRTKGTSLNQHSVVLTVPASFDEEARELTVQAAQDAGIEKVTLLEEPAAAFYAWIAGHL